VLVHLVLSEEEAIHRIGGRRIDPVTQEIFGSDFTAECNPKTGNRLVVRDDDTPEAVSHRIEIFKKETFPILEACEREGRAILPVDAHGTPDEVFDRLQKALLPYLS